MPVGTGPGVPAGEPVGGGVTTGSERLVLGRYRLVRRLGSGGFGVVWLAHDQRLNRAVAIKRIPAGDEAVAARAEREAVAAARLSHPAIVALYEAGSDDEAVYLVSELVRGRTFADLLDAGELSDRDVLGVGMTLCDALAHAHGRGVIHRDVKPQNVIVPDRHADGGPAKLTDFGIAHVLGDDGLTRTGDVIGTLAYMAPEQADGGQAGEAADLYSLGLVVYEGLAGINPVRGAGAAETARRVGRRLPALSRWRGDLPHDLCAAVDAAVDPRPDARGSLADLRAALATALPRADDVPGALTAATDPAFDEGPDGFVVGPEFEPWDDEDDDGDSGIRTPAARRWLRGSAALAAGGLAGAALALLGPPPPLDPVAGAAVAALGVLLLPRLGWIAVATALVLWLAAAPDAPVPGVAAVLAAAAAPTALLLRRCAPLSWSSPVLGPALGAVGAALAWPALAGQALRAHHRAALGFMGVWWLALAEPVVGRRLLLGSAPDTWARGAWEGSFVTAASHAIAPMLAGGVLAIGLWWALGATVLPFLVRGRSVFGDLLAAAAWAVALAAGTQAIADALRWPGVEPEVRGLVVGAVAAALLAVAAAPRADPRVPRSPPARSGRVSRRVR